MHSQFERLYSAGRCLHDPDDFTNPADVNESSVCERNVLPSPTLWSKKIAQLIESPAET